MGHGRKETRTGLVVSAKGLAQHHEFPGLKAFGRRHPGHYIAMFESGISLNRTPELAAAAQRARAVLEHAAADLCEHIPPDKRPPASMFSAHIWALSHGVVELYARNAPGTASPFSPEDLLESGIGIYLRGLGLIDPDR